MHAVCALGRLEIAAERMKNSKQKTAKQHALRCCFDKESLIKMYLHKSVLASASERERGSAPYETARQKLQTILMRGSSLSHSPSLPHSLSLSPSPGLCKNSIGNHRLIHESITELYMKRL